MFINNKYTNTYTSLIAQALNRELDRSIYTEKHHIIPKCMGGPDTPDNLVRLTAKEHYIAHLLLTKMTEGVYKRKMCFALWRMTQDNTKRNTRHTVTATQYEIIKRMMAQAARDHNKGRKPSDEERQRIKDGLARVQHKRKGIRRSQEFKQKIAKARTGSMASDATKQKISEGLRAWNDQRKGTTRSLKGRKIPRYTTVVEHKTTGEQFTTTHLREWLAERGIKPHHLHLDRCDYIVVKRFITRTGEEIPVKRT